MKRFISSISFLFLFIIEISAGVLTLEGEYQGQNIYVQNPSAGEPGVYCTDDVIVNGEVVMSNIKSSAYEIDLSKYTIGDQISIKIIYKENCKPKIINPDALRSRQTFETVSFTVDKGNIKFTTKGETIKGKFLLEQLRNNKWTVIGEVEGKGGQSFNNYTYEITHHSGLNTYRFKQMGPDGKFVYSKPVDFKSDKGAVTFYPNRVAYEIYFSEETNFEIFDSYGNIVKKGFAKQVNVEDLEAGVYYMNIDNRTEKFLKK
ncbi:MAG: hypothetical protein A3H98_11830 [Bacteroidetes bacterium RIFCSPLOWO2_02_FULL_36_8]|nr:MAG: hypothetical protein A3H98_11830 [Bacteroidetes bacterium RIFCSPLOWO2_02_FULL_36_8]OFY69460.1 MAG: hypothetical protein A3G23_00820 [Bacteroidetes bacterium RIFCSPLOWO2_12_FULL_37_12]